MNNITTTTLHSKNPDYSRTRIRNNDMPMTFMTGKCKVYRTDSGAFVLSLDSIDPVVAEIKDVYEDLRALIPSLELSPFNTKGFGHALFPKLKMSYEPEGSTTPRKVITRFYNENNEKLTEEDISTGSCIAVIQLDSVLECKGSNPPHTRAEFVLKELKYKADPTHLSVKGVEL